MKNTTVQVSCGIALAVMAGAVGSHWFSVKQTVALAAGLQSKSGVPALASPAAEDPAVREARQILAEAKAATGKREMTVSAPANSSQDGRIERLISSCEALMAQNSELKGQVAETNRDLMALQFQVDSHSASFRPLRIAEDQTPAPADGVLPPKEAP
jgi:hypothetical protein